MHATLTFTEVAQQLGVAHIDNASGSAAWGDYDNDGDDDLYVTSATFSITGPQSLNRLYRNDVNISGFFVDVAQQMGIDEPEPASRGAAWCDFDNNGLLDLYLCNNSYSYPDSTKLFVKYDSVFVNEASLFKVSNWGRNTSCSWGDYDNDGDQDLYVCVLNYPGYISKLYRNDGNYFTNVTQIYNVAGGINSSTANWIDYDNDGDLDLYIYNSAFSNILYENRVDEDNTFEDVTVTYGLNDSGADGASTWFDYDNDGDLDLFLSNSLDPNFPYIDPPSKIYRNDLNTSNQFIELTNNLGFGDTLSTCGCAVGDYDLDGDLDLYLAVLRNKNKYYRNDINTSGVFTKIENQMGMSDTLLSVSASVNDYDDDGDLDVYVVNWPRENCLLFRNNINSQNFFKIRLTDKQGNYNRFGSRVKVYIAGTNNLVGMRIVDGGGSGGKVQNEYDCHFGLDPNLAYDIEVIFTTRSNGQNHVFDKNNRPELGNVVPSQIGHFLEVRDSVVMITDIKPGKKPQLINQFKLYQNYPNPFNPLTTIRFNLPKTEKVSLTIYNLMGQVVKTYSPGELNAGEHEFVWNGQDENNVPVSSGVYIYQLKSGKDRQVKKMVLLK